MKKVNANYTSNQIPPLINWELLPEKLLYFPDR